MRLNRNLVVVSLVSVAAATVTIAAPTTAPTTQSMKPHAVRLVHPWNLLADLSDDQKGQINTIHENTSAAIKELGKAETDKCMALLSDPQKKELEEAIAKAAASKKKPKK